MVKGLTIDDPTQPFQQCEPCIQAKQHRQSFPKEAEHRSEQPGELTYSDVWGPARVASIGGSKYYISFTDDHSRRCTPLFMKNKHEAFDKIKEYITHVERKFGTAPKYLRVDNGKELISQKVKDWLKSKGIELQNSAPYSPEQMGVAERFNRTLIELVRAMLISQNLPSFLWAEAVAHAAYIRNRAPTKALDGKTPHEAWTGEKPNVSHL
jgi:transposase InsO family protein